MFLKIVLPLMVFWTYGNYDGVQCAIEDADLQNFNTHRHYDVMHFLNYDIHDFDTHNRQCYLAFLVYLSKRLFFSTEESKMTKNINGIDEFSANISRVINVEFTSKFDFKTFVLHEKIRVWFHHSYDEGNMKLVVDESTAIIKMGLDKYLWKTEKEFEIIGEYRNDKNTEKKLTRRAYEMCTASYNHLASPTKRIGIWCSDEYRHKPGGITNWRRSYIFKPTEIRDFGTVSLFLTFEPTIRLKYFNRHYEIDNVSIAPYESIYQLHGYMTDSNNIDEFKTFFDDESQKSRNLYLLEYLEQVIIDIIQGINTVLLQINFLLPYIPEAYDFPSDTSIQSELLVILRHLYLKVTDTTQDLYLLLKMSRRRSYLVTQYKKFSVFFKHKWSTILSFPESFKKKSLAYPPTIPKFIPAPQFVQRTKSQAIREAFTMNQGLSIALSKDTAAPNIVQRTQSSGLKQANTSNSNNQGLRNANSINQGLRSEVAAQNTVQRKTAAPNIVQRTNTINQGPRNGNTNGQCVDATSKDKNVLLAISNAHIARTCSFDDAEISSQFQESCFANLQSVDQSRFYRDRRVQPSLIRFYSVFNNSWTDDTPDETNINQMKVFLYELNAILTIVKHNVYTLMVAARNKQETSPVWDCGFINGCNGQITGTLSNKLQSSNIISKKYLDYELMEELTSARMFFKHYSRDSEHLDAVIELEPYF